MLSHRNDILVRHLNIESAKIKVLSTYVAEKFDLRI